LADARRVPIGIAAADSAASVATESAAERLARYVRPGTLSFAALPPLSLYIHLPWCLKKCPYCDFNSHEWRGDRAATAADGSADGSSTAAPLRAADVAGGGSGLASAAKATAPLPEARYIDAVVADLEAALPFVWGRKVHSIFIGGGTPSLFAPASIDRLLADVRARMPLEPGCEITLEANPGTFERDRFRAFRAAGVTRLSIGVQSFDDRSLQALGRVHDRAQAIAAIEEAAQAFETFNIDLMYALPEQTMAAFEADLETALAFRPPHLSVYHLTIEPNTLFARRPPPLPDDDTAYAMLDRIVERTGVAGLERYEVSAFARPGHRCAHNLNYWQFGDYLGIGAGAHGKLTFPHRVLRQTRFRDPVRYMSAALAAEPAAGGAIAQDTEVSRADLPFEFVLNALRLPEGFELARFVERTGLGPAALEPALTRAEQRGLVERDLHRVRPTGLGLDFLNDLQALFLPPAQLSEER
jgi:putative oxygen-independent coproporphyrinogen III oxidase